MNKYRTHLCSELNISNLNEEVTLSGWIDTIRDHGNLLFIDLRDNYGITQCVVDDFLGKCSDENLFHLINHCKLHNLKMYFASSADINTYDFKFRDLYSRLREFIYLEIKSPDDEMCKMLMAKLFSDKQIIIKNKEIFDFIFKRLNRTYFDIYIFVERLDRLSLEKKRQLTIPLIKEII